MAAFSSNTVDLGPADLGEDIQRLFDDLARQRHDRRHLVAGECLPVVDVFLTERGVEVVMDVPGMSADAIRILIKNGVVLIVGEKERPEPSKRAPVSFHLVERDFGRFVRAVRLHTAVDASAARARLVNGELHVVLPRLTDRRGQGMLVPIESQATPADE